MGAMLDENGINMLLVDLINDLEAGNTEQAEGRLESLDFERLMRPITTRSKPPQTIDPAEDFGVERVHETGAHLRSCARALTTGNLRLAIEAARAAETRWRKPAGRT